MLSQNLSQWAFPGLRLIQIFLLLAIMPFAAHARSGSEVGSVTLEWDSNPEPNVNGYNVHFGTESGTYNTVINAGNQSELEVLDLEFGVTYYCAVTAYNTIGLESEFSAEIAITYLGGNGDAPEGRLVLLEAEDGNLTPPMVVQATGQESWVQDDTISQGGRTEIEFTAQVGAGYYTWCRVKAVSGASDSFFVSMDGAPEEVFHVYDTPTPPPSVYTDDWVWRRINLLSGQPRIHTLTAGSHTISFRSREAGVMLDRVVMVTDRDFVPNDSLPRSGDVLTVTNPPTSRSVAPGGNATLNVIAIATGPIQYQWVKEGLAIDGETGPSLEISAADAEDAGSYSVFIWSDTAIKSAGPAALTVVEPPFQVTSINVATDRSVTFNLSGQYGKEIQVYASSGLNDWTLISTQTNIDGTISVDDPGAVNQEKRFYRLVTPTP